MMFRNAMLLAIFAAPRDHVAGDFAVGRCIVTAGAGADRLPLTPSSLAVELGTAAQIGVECATLTHAILNIQAEHCVMACPSSRVCVARHALGRLRSNRAFSIGGTFTPATANVPSGILTDYQHRKRLVRHFYAAKALKPVLGSLRATIGSYFRRQLKPAPIVPRAPLLSGKTSAVEAALLDKQMIPQHAFQNRAKIGRRLQVAAFIQICAGHPRPVGDDTSTSSPHRPQAARRLPFHGPFRWCR